MISCSISLYPLPQWLGDVTQFDEHILQVGWKLHLAMVSRSTTTNDGLYGPPKVDDALHIPKWIFEKLATWHNT